MFFPNHRVHCVKAIVRGPRTQSEKDRILRAWRRKEHFGWIFLIVVNGFFVLFMFRVTQYYPSAVMRRWAEGCLLSTTSFVTGTPLVRSLSFLRMSFSRWAMYGSRHFAFCSVVAQIPCG